MNTSTPDKRHPNRAHAMTEENGIERKPATEREKKHDIMKTTTAPLLCLLNGSKN